MTKTKASCCHNGERQVRPSKSLIITWQRLIVEEDTCPRCRSTEYGLAKALSLLRRSLAPLNVKVELEKSELSLVEFKKKPSKSNSIQLNGVPLEKLLKAETGQSQCCGACGDEECRTLELKGASYEAIPANIIVRAGLIAAAKIL